MRYRVYLVDDINGNQYFRYESDDHFNCEVWMNQHLYDAPHDCHYDIFNMEQ